MRHGNIQKAPAFLAAFLHQYHIVGRNHHHRKLADVIGQPLLHRAISFHDAALPKGIFGNYLVGIAFIQDKLALEAKKIGAMLHQIFIGQANVALAQA